MSDFKWIRKGRDTNNNNINNNINIQPVPTPNTINGLSGSDLILSPSNNILRIYLNGDLITIINIHEIISWNIQGRVIELITEDPTPLRLEFININEALIGLNVIEATANL
jgi:hypothetical protein